MSTPSLFYHGDKWLCIPGSKRPRQRPPTLIPLILVVCFAARNLSFCCIQRQDFQLFPKGRQLRLCFCGQYSFLLWRASLSCMSFSKRLIWTSMALLILEPCLISPEQMACVSHSVIGVVSDVWFLAKNRVNSSVNFTITTESRKNDLFNLHWNSVRLVPPSLPLMWQGHGQIC